VSDTALLVVDMLNSYRHEDADKLATSVADIVDQTVGRILDQLGVEHDLSPRWGEEKGTVPFSRTRD